MKYVFLALSLFVVACNKEPGEGGKAEIRGRVLEQRYNGSENPVGDPYPAPEQNVYIVYGGASDGFYPDDNVDTGPNGEFRFTWLRKGSYTIYTMSECDACPGQNKAVLANVEVGDKKEVVDTGILTIENY